MGHHEPSNAVPIELGKRYRRKAARERNQRAGKLLGAAALVGAAVGIGSVAVTPDDATAVAAALKPFAVSAGLVRARAPQQGDYWSGCNDARAAGTAPIYAGEPGYRSGMDGDSDGIACEPYRG